jgi:hypothetical protein
MQSTAPHPTKAKTQPAGVGAPWNLYVTLIILRSPLPEIVQEFRYRVDAGNQQMIPGAGTGNVEQMALGIIDFLQIGIVADRLDALLQGNYFVVAGH